MRNKIDSVPLPKISHTARWEKKSVILCRFLILLNLVAPHKHHRHSQHQHWQTTGIRRHTHITESKSNENMNTPDTVVRIWNLFYYDLMCTECVVIQSHNWHLSRYVQEYFAEQSSHQAMNEHTIFVTLRIYTRIFKCIFSAIEWHTRNQHCDTHVRAVDMVMSTICDSWHRLRRHLAVSMVANGRCTYLWMEIIHL